MAIALAIITFGIPQIGYAMGIGRTLTFFPFFLLGLLYGSFFIKHAKESGLIYTVVAILILLIGLYLFSDWNILMLYGSLSYAAQNISFVDGAFIKLCTYMLSTIFAACFLYVALKTAVFNRFGRMSLYIYVWHGIVVIFYKNFYDKNKLLLLSEPFQIGIILFVSFV
ncbi:MAG: hypothetical protein GX664_00385, partial [Bacteroidales bacterium]|nr:hypothetical protein [Bacteroidales bacterium]